MWLPFVYEILPLDCQFVQEQLQEGIFWVLPKAGTPTGATDKASDARGDGDGQAATEYDGVMLMTKSPEFRRQCAGGAMKHEESHNHASFQPFHSFSSLVICRLTVFPILVHACTCLYMLLLAITHCCQSELGSLLLSPAMVIIICIKAFKWQAHHKINQL